MVIETANDLASMMDVNEFADTVTKADESTFLGYFHQGYIESVDISGRRAALLCISADVVGISVGASLFVASTGYTVGAIEPGDRLTTMYLEAPL